MSYRKDIVALIQYHKSWPNFDYQLAVDWAIALIENGIDDERVYMLASFSKPIDPYEIMRYVKAALASQGLEEKEDEFFIIAQAHYYLIEILNDRSIRKNLALISQFCIEQGYPHELMTFYLLYFAWDDLEYSSFSWHYENVTIDNIEATLKEQATLWIETYINPAL